MQNNRIKRQKAYQLLKQKLYNYVEAQKKALYLVS